MTSLGEGAVADDVREDDLTRRVIGSAITVHRALGCGLLESAYDECLAYEFVKNGFGVARHVAMPIIYDGVRVELGYKPDLIIDGELIVELKTVSQLLPVHEAQLLTYLRLFRHHTRPADELPLSAAREGNQTNDSFAQVPLIPPPRSQLLRGKKLSVLCVLRGKKTRLRQIAT
ncbi:MAG: GxxExxY protein [Gemmatimonadota bacterium]|nr:GxxExxY protein [Gemmatimonadota bacterium]